jgi:hypothetical protein
MPNAQGKAQTVRHVYSSDYGKEGEMARIGAPVILAGIDIKTS